MRSSAGWLAAVAAIGVPLAGCRDGVYLDIHTSRVPGVDRVALYIANERCDDCDGNYQAPIKLPAGPREFFVRDNSEVTLIATVTDGVATFEFTPQPVTLPVVIAVGTAGDDTPDGVVVMAKSINLADSPHRFEAELVAVGGPPNPTYAEWGTPRCVAAINANDNKTYVVVGTDDHDCDGVASAVDCEDTDFSQGERSLCAVPNDTGQCMLGTQCGPRLQCEVDVEADTCVPKELCMGTPCGYLDRGCLEQQLANPGGQVTALHCRVDVNPQGGLCLFPLNVPSPSPSCAPEVELYGPDDLFFSGHQQLDLGPLSIAVTPATKPGCAPNAPSHALQMSGNPPFTGMGPLGAFIGIIDPVTNRRLIAPVIATFSISDCTTPPPDCAFVSDGGFVGSCFRP